tara:strand:+ start:407 stop:1999 length:1593 start_codon:yes stop_codon:yes gene_type:complete
MNTKNIKPIIVLSLFDGMSGTQLALRERKIPVETYYASEIDKYAISVTKKNFPNTKFIGDITQVNGKDLGKVDLVVGGSPCQGFSFSGKRVAFDHPQSKLFFEFHRLLKECQEINPNLYFILENVRMAKKHKEVIDDHMGVDSIEIDSALLSAQRRRRLYWTNIPNVTQPQDLGLVLKDILEDDVREPMYSNIYGGFDEAKPREHYGKSVTIRTSTGGGHIPSVNKRKPKKIFNTHPSGKGMNGWVYDTDSVSPPLTTNKGEGNKIYTRIEKQQVKVRKHKLDKQFVLLLRDCRSMAKLSKGITTRDIAKHCGVPLTQAEHWFRKDSSFSIPPSEIWNKLKEILNAETMLKEYDKFITEFEVREGVYEMSERITEPHGKNPTLKASEPNKVDDKYYLTEKMADFIVRKPHNYEIGDRNTIDPKIARPLKATYHKGQRAFEGTYVSTEYKPFDKTNIRKLTTIECSRLQTVKPDSYTKSGIDENGNTVTISNTQQYKMLGNGFTVSVIAHILSFTEGNPQPVKRKKQLKLL